MAITRFDTVSFPPMSENTQSSRRMTSDSVSKSLKFPSKPPNAKRGRLWAVCWTTLPREGVFY